MWRIIQPQIAAENISKRYAVSEYLLRRPVKSQQWAVSAKRVDAASFVSKSSDRVERGRVASGNGTGQQAHA